MPESSGPRGRRGSGRRADPRTLLRFMEELSWLLSSYEDLDFRALGNLIGNIEDAQRAVKNIRVHSPGRPATTQVLVGSLPGLLTDERLIRTNEDIVEFSNVALGIDIPRWQKKSKYELIGHIVCHTDQANPHRLDRMVKALTRLIDDKGDARRALEAQRQSGLSWNEVIQKLLNGSS